MLLDKIKEYIDKKGISIAAFEKSIGMSNASFGKSLKNGKSIGTDKLEKILSVYPDLSVDWLFHGKEPMIIDNDRDNIPVALHSDNNHGIPLIPFSAMAGALNGEMTALEYECERYVVPAFNGADFLMPVKGDSMQPTYQSGDIVACKRIPLTDLFFQWNKPYILDTNQGPIIKRINPGSDQEHIQIVSDNPKYKPFELRYTDIHSVAQVIGIIRLE